MRYSLLLLCIFGMQNLAAQQKEQKPINDSGWHFSARAGYDFPKFDNSTPFIHYRGGLEAGLSINYYWDWFGIGGDLDHIGNKPKNDYPPENVVYENNAVGNFSLSGEKITRLFYGIGPSFKYQRNNQFSAELKLRAGLANIKGGRLSLDAFQNNPGVLNFHGGYDRKNQFSAKASIQFNYFFNDYWGVHVGSYFLEHFNTPERVDGAKGISSGFRDYYQSDAQVPTQNVVIGEQNLRTEPCNCEVYSVGIYAGITYRLTKNKKPEKKKITPKYGLVVVAKDKYSLELLPNTEVVIKNAKDEIIHTGKTDDKAEIEIDSIMPDNYKIDGTLFGKSLDGAKTVKTEFLPNQILRKTILYGDLHFILKGKIIDQKTKQPLDAVSVLPKDGTLVVTDANGNFQLPINPKTENPLYLKKDHYFSKTETVPADKANRKKSLYLEMEFEMEPFDCGKAIRLENIHYDLDKFFIREDAKPELDKLVQFLKDNPEVKVELSSHTDCRASHAYNEKLSQNRANAAVDYIVSQGIDRGRLIGKGYGETKLLNHCADKVRCTEEEHQRNRRTEMKVICP